MATADAAINHVVPAVADPRRIVDNNAESTSSIWMMTRTIRPAVAQANMRSVPDRLPIIWSRNGAGTSTTQRLIGDYPLAAWLTESQSASLQTGAGDSGGRTIVGWDTCLAGLGHDVRQHPYGTRGKLGAWRDRPSRALWSDQRDQPRAGWIKIRTEALHATVLRAIEVLEWAYRDGAGMSIMAGQDEQRQRFSATTTTMARSGPEDYTVWKNTFGKTVTAGTGADGNGNTQSRRGGLHRLAQPLGELGRRLALGCGAGAVDGDAGCARAGRGRRGGLASSVRSDVRLRLPSAMNAPSRRRVLLVGWDAADWKVIHPLMDAGKMPTVARLVERGAMASLATLHPVLSPMLWTSIATGKRPFKHGVLGFTEPSPDGAGIRPVTNLSRKTKAIWNILSQNGSDE